MTDLHQLLPNNHITIDVTHEGAIVQVELQPLSRSQLQRMAAMDAAINVHRSKFEQNPDLLLDPIEYERYIARESQLQAQSDAGLLQMLICKWGDRTSLTSLELQSESMAEAVEQVYQVIALEEVRSLLFRRSKSTPDADPGVAKVSVAS